MEIIKGKKITLQYKGTDHPVLKNVDFVIKRNRITIFLGKSGSGKTSLLKCLVNILSDYEGSIEYLDELLKDMKTIDRINAIGFVSQQYSLFPHMTVLENCVHPQIHVLKRKPEEALKKAKELLKQLDILSLCDRLPHELSGGQQQRVAIARALGMNSKILLLDEPSSALDPASTTQLKNLLIDLQNQGITIVLSTHDLFFVKGLMDRVYLMENGQIIEEFDDKKNTLSKESNIYEYINNF